MKHSHVLVEKMEQVVSRRVGNVDAASVISHTGKLNTESRSGLAILDDLNLLELHLVYQELTN